MNQPRQRRQPRRLGPPADQLSPRQRELLDELEAVFLEQGFARVTVEQLTDRLRCSRRALYEIAPTKNDLVLLVIDRRMRRTGRRTRALLAELSDPAAKLATYLESGHAEVHHLSTAFANDVSNWSPAQELVADHYRYSMVMLRDVLDEGMSTGAFRDLPSAAIAEVVYGALARFLDPSFQRDSGLTFDSAVTALQDLLQHGLLVAARS